MIISCPQCSSRYRIDSSGANKTVARVKCPGCQHLFEIDLTPVPVVPTDSVASRPKVLIVDDARFFREMIKDILHDLPIDIVEAADGKDALEKVLSDQPQLVLLDLNIPGLSGLELTREVRSRPELSNIRIIAMSGVQRGEDTATLVRSHGADDFLNKSFRPNDLQKRVRSYLGI